MGTLEDLTVDLKDLAEIIERRGDDLTGYSLVVTMKNTDDNDPAVSDHVFMYSVDSIMEATSTLM